MAPYLISLEGNIGSGKSTILNHLKEHIHYAGSRRVVYVDEPLDQWEKIKNDQGVTMLELFYQNPKKYAFSFQMMAYISRLANLQEAIEKYPNCIIMMERSLMTDYHVFAKMLRESNDILPEEYAIYTQWFDYFNTTPMDALIYLQCSPETSLERSKQRNRTGESISLDYMTKVHDFHEAWIRENHYHPILMIDNEDTSLDDALFCIEDFLMERVIPNDGFDDFIEHYSSYAYIKMALCGLVISILALLQKA
jgi:deoxyadenosine/deoxycytidine kinase